MAGFTCPHCGKTHDENVMHCPNTGRELGKTCRQCWNANPFSATFCVVCGVKLSDARFGVPHDVAEKFGEAFASYDWPRQIKSMAIQNAFTIDYSREIVVFACTIQEGSWLPKAESHGTTIHNRREGEPAGHIAATSQRFFVADKSTNRAWEYPYDDIRGASVTGNSDGQYPIFTLDFGKHGTVRLYRTQMPKFMKGPNLLDLKINPMAGRMSTNTTITNVAVGGHLKNAVNENNLVVTWFDTVADLRRKLG